MTRIVLGALPAGQRKHNILGRRPCPQHHRGGDLCIPTVRLGAARVLAAPFYLPIWKDPLTGNQSARCTFDLDRCRHPHNRPVPKVCRFSLPASRILNPSDPKGRHRTPSVAAQFFGVTRLRDPASIGSRLHSRSSRPPLLLSGWGGGAACKRYAPHDTRFLSKSVALRTHRRFGTLLRSVRCRMGRF
jgi:hypothetical protein